MKCIIKLIIAFKIVNLNYWNVVSLEIKMTRLYVMVKCIY